MSKQGSPFAALTNRERQERWLEFQSAKLPYTQGNVDSDQRGTAAETTEKEAHEPSAQKSLPQMKNKLPEKAEPPARLTERMHESIAPQKPSHRHYDAILKRMNDAKRQANGFQRWE